MVAMSADAINLEKSKIHRSFKITRSVRWGEYLALVLQWKVFFGLANPASDSRMLLLVEQTAIELKTRLEQSLGAPP